MTALLRNVSIRLRMRGAIAMVLVLLLLVGGAGLWGLTQVDRKADRFVEEVHAETVLLASLRTSLGNVRRFEKDLVINYDSEKEQADYASKWEQAVAKTREHARQLGGFAVPEIQAGARRIDELLGRYREAAQPVMRQLAVLGFNDAPVANRALDAAKTHIRATEEEVERIAAALAKQVEAARIARRGDMNLTYALMLGCTLLAAGIVVPLTLANSASIVGPIARARDLAQGIADGDLTRHVHDEGRDEAADLLRALARMQESLRGMVGQVRGAADSIRTASSEVASGNQDLSTRTEQTASNLQQTASSIEQLTGTVTQTADAARTANQLAASASEVAGKGGAVVAQVVSTMDEIHAASRRIADIIATIDGIAFQTNILALNAAVEAARAGEQGRGFAVVAGEVRSLAQRSAEAAREIKGLIGASVDKVENGSRLVADAGQTMQEIVASVQRVTDMIGEISAAAGEQSQGIGQVNAAVTQLDQMTQQNAALVEQSAAAAESLREQARQLAQAVAAFRTEDGHGDGIVPSTIPASDRRLPA